MGLRRTLFSFTARAVLRIFYRRWEVAGLENVPASGPCLVVSNHNNALVDPLAVGIVWPRRIRYVAKATLWHNPVLAFVLNVTDAIPVARPEDRRELPPDADPAEVNRAAFAALERALDSGECVGMFPEGTSRARDDLARLRSGASFVALEYARRRDYREALPILPVGLSWSNPEKFRSDVAVVIGEPVDTTPFHQDHRERGCRAHDPLTARITGALRAATLLGRKAAFRRRVEKACDLLEAMHERDPERFPLPEEGGEPLGGVSLRLRAFAHAEELSRNDPARLRRLNRAIRRYEALERAAGLAPRITSPVGRPVRVASVGGWFLELLLTAGTFPLVAAGAVLWAPIYFLARLAGRYPRSGEPDARASRKVFAALVFGPVWYVLLAVGLGLIAPRFGIPWWGGTGVALLSPLVAWWALRRIETLRELVGAGLVVFRRAAVGGELTRRRARAAGLLREEVFAAG